MEIKRAFRLSDQISLTKLVNSRVRERHYLKRKKKKVEKIEKDSPMFMCTLLHLHELVGIYTIYRNTNST